MITRETLVVAFGDWLANRAYRSCVNAQGDHYRIKETGRIAPWSEAVLQSFHSSDHFHFAAEQFGKTGCAAVPIYQEHENVRVTFYADRVVVEVADQGDFSVISGWAADVLVGAVKGGARG